MGPTDGIGSIVALNFCTIYFGFAQEIAVSDITVARARALGAVAAGLISVVISGSALALSGRRPGSGNGRGMALVGGGLGLIGIVVSVIHLPGSTGFGTGGVRAGAIVAIVLAVIGTSLGGLALARSRRTKE